MGPFSNPGVSLRIPQNWMEFRCHLLCFFNNNKKLLFELRGKTDALCLLECEVVLGQQKLLPWDQEHCQRKWRKKKPSWWPRSCDQWKASLILLKLPYSIYILTSYALRYSHGYLSFRLCCRLCMIGILNLDTSERERDWEWQQTLPSWGGELFCSAKLRGLHFK